MYMTAYSSYIDVGSSYYTEVNENYDASKKKVYEKKIMWKSKFIQTVENWRVYCQQSMEAV